MASKQQYFKANNNNEWYYLSENRFCICWFSWMNIHSNTAFMKNVAKPYVAYMIDKLQIWHLYFSVDVRGYFEKFEGSLCRNLLQIVWISLIQIRWFERVVRWGHYKQEESLQMQERLVLGRLWRSEAIERIPQHRTSLSFFEKMEFCSK